MNAMIELQKDIKMFFNSLFYGEFGDVQIEDGDFILDGGLETAVLISLFSDARVSPDESRDQFNGEIRGFWAEKLIGFNLGNKVWLLDRSKLTNNVLRLSEQYNKEALQWMIDEGIAARIETVSLKSTTRPNTMQWYIAIYKPEGGVEGFKYDIPWNNQLGR